MSQGKIDSKGEILQNIAVTGLNYTGVGQVGVLGGGQPLRYGFICATSQDGGILGTLLTGSQQVILPFPPTSITQSESASTQITYTQNSGKYIERHGQTVKIITIEGTTGYTPTPVIPDAARNILPQQTIISTEGPASGLAQFLTLRNIFRSYWDTFSDDSQVNNRGNTLFIWVNEKDDEVWIVEPMDFTMRRNAPGDKFKYNYSIILHTVAPVTGMNFDVDPLTLYQKVNNYRNLVATAVNDITAAAAVLSTALSTLAGAVRDAVTTVASILTDIASDLQGVATGIQDLAKLPEYIKGNADDVENSFMGAWTALLDVSSNSTTTFGTDPLPFTVHQALTDAATTLAVLSARQEIFSSDFPSTWSNIIENYNAAYGWGGFNQNLIEPLQRSGVQETVILPGDTLQTIAVRELGDVERFLELVVLNSLKPPYISPSQTDRQPNTLAPGDALLIPAVATQDGARAPIRTTVFTDPVFTGVVTAYTAPNILTVDTQGNDFRTNQWQGFTLSLSGGPMTVIPGVSPGYSVGTQLSYLTTPGAGQIYVPSATVGNLSGYYAFIINPGGATQETFNTYGFGTTIYMGSLVGTCSLVGSTFTYPHAAGELVVAVGTQIPAPPTTYSAPPYNGVVGLIESNTSNTLTLQTSLTTAPNVGSIARIALVRDTTDLAPQKSAQQQLLGVDYMMQNGDWVADASGNVALVDSIANLQQAVAIKMQVAPGELPAHPTFGLAFDPGQRATPDLLFAYRVAVQQSFLSDPRIDSLQNLTLSVTRDVLSAQFTAVLSGGSQAYALDTKGST